MARQIRKPKKTERHVVVCAFVVETPEGTDISNTESNGVIPNLVNEVDERLGGLTQKNGKGTLYEVVDVTMFTEKGFMYEVRKHGHPRRFPDVYADGPPIEMNIKRLRSSPPPKKRKIKIKPKNNEEATR